jgi:CBS domain-containing protein
MERPIKTVRQLLGAKHSEVSGVISVTPTDTVLSALKLMREKDIGAVIVLEGGQLRGILTERDYAREVELEGRTAKDCLVHQIMTDRALFYARFNARLS